ncbi:hypothetical protein MSG28_008012 [Choristoneura fumiferana]|uniref:Uncharacterized protein n=1 Tax=Choristoneura fumiferana TaxID=7141 RepID=A0ACC0J9X4_CHOFU|nr:hypothetical protein MSG28_008012 [Choristoneura fumiferana]
MLKRIAFLLLATTALSAEIPRNSLEKTAFNPDPNAEPVSTHPVSKKASEPELDPRPIYKTEERTNGRARIAPVRPQGQIVKYDQMLADQPNSAATEVNRVDNQQIPNYAFVPGPAEVAYPDIPYAPGYGYENGYPPSSGYVGKTISWIFGSIFMLLLGSFLTVGVCTYTNICTITMQGFGPIHEEMRSLITPERLEKIGTAADFVKTAIDKYQKIQNVDAERRKRRALFNNY